jgi:hypothetical protein
VSVCINICKVAVLVIYNVQYIPKMTTNPSDDPVPYRKDLRKKIEIEDPDSENEKGQKESNANED